MKNIRIIFLGLAFLGLSACANPFNLKAIEKEINGISPFSGFRNAVIVSGATAPVVTSGGYKVTSSIGGIAKSTTVTTGGGYRVFSNSSAE